MDEDRMVNSNLDHLHVRQVFVLAFKGMPKNPLP